MFEKESGEIKRVRGEMDGSKERGKKKGRDLLFLVFFQVGPSQGIPEAF